MGGRGASPRADNWPTEGGKAATSAFPVPDPASFPERDLGAACRQFNCYGVTKQVLGVRIVRRETPLQRTQSPQSLRELPPALLFVLLCHDAQWDNFPTGEVAAFRSE